MDDEKRTRKLTSEEIHRLATMPLPSVSVIKSQYCHAGNPTKEFAGKSNNMYAPEISASNLIRTF